MAYFTLVAAVIVGVVTIGFTVAARVSGVWAALVVLVVGEARATLLAGWTASRQRSDGPRLHVWSSFPSAGLRWRGGYSA